MGLIIKIQTPSNTEEEALAVLQEILDIDGEECPFEIIEYQITKV